ncbi:hypothetical protein [uncultured Gammaproteobacteria bacterium]|nr:hypothetical protein [uncultured Gammaproteobacteria bacterium]
MPREIASRPKISMFLIGAEIVSEDINKLDSKANLRMIFFMFYKPKIK